MDTDTGDIFGMASVQRNDDNVVEITSGNYAAVAAYEPGSVAKVVTDRGRVSTRVSSRPTARSSCRGASSTPTTC